MRNSIALLPGASTTRGAVTSLHCRVARGAQSLADDCITTYLKAASQAQKATKQAIRNRKQNLDRKVSAELSSKGTLALQDAMESQVRSQFLEISCPSPVMKSNLPHKVTAMSRWSNSDICTAPASTSVLMAGARNAVIQSSPAGAISAVLGAELLRRATQIGVLDGVEHLACERQRSAAMILLADEVEFRPRRLMALEAIEPQEVVNFLRSLRAPESSVSPSNNKIAIKIAVLEPHDGLPIGNA